MIQKYMVTIDSDKRITAKEVEDALNHGNGVFSLDFIHDDIVVATVKKVRK